MAIDKVLTPGDLTQRNNDGISARDTELRVARHILGDKLKGADEADSRNSGFYWSSSSYSVMDQPRIASESDQA